VSEGAREVNIFKNRYLMGCYEYGKDVPMTGLNERTRNEIMFEKNLVEQTLLRSPSDLGDCRMLVIFVQKWLAKE
jgi:hypothetical protein